ncbi:collagenase [Rheinheimera riviphila]|nr:collagenase [Rheinheimera riviphila]
MTKMMFLFRCQGLLNSCLLISSLIVSGIANANPAATRKTASVDQILSQQHQCSTSLTLRSAALTQPQQQAACAQLAAIEQRFHQLFQTAGKPVKHDHNTMLRANIYQSKQQYVEFAGQHFQMPTDNGGMYLEGFPDLPGNQAEFVAYQREQGQVWNLSHEFVHYLDGRFNLYGDFCATLHDSHAPPENCPTPAPDTPYLIWWTEGMAEYVAHGADNPEALKLATTQQFKLSELFHTGYERNHGSDRIYRWGYLAARFLLEQQRPQVDRMLNLLRNGDYPRYQALVRSWGTSMDQEFSLWLKQQAVTGIAVTPVVSSGKNSAN